MFALRHLQNFLKTRFHVLPRRVLKRIFLKNMAKPQKPAVEVKGQSFFYKLVQIVFSPYQIMQSLIEQRLNNSFPRNLLTGRYTFAETDSFISLQEMKEISSNQGVRFSTLLFAALTGALREYYLKQQGQDDPTGHLPDSILILSPFPLSDHPGTLTNHVTVAPVRVPLSEANPFRRLQLIDKRLNYLRTSYIPHGFQILMTLIGGQFSCLINLIMRSNGRSILGGALLSNIPGLPKGFVNSEDDIKAISLHMLGGIPFKNLPISIFCISFNAKITLRVNVDDALIDPNKTADISEQILNGILNQLQMLKTEKHDTNIV